MQSTQGGSAGYFKPFLLPRGPLIHHSGCRGHSSAVNHLQLAVYCRSQPYVRVCVCVCDVKSAWIHEVPSKLQVSTEETCRRSFVENTHFALTAGGHIQRTSSLFDAITSHSRGRVGRVGHGAGRRVAFSYAPSSSESQRLL